MSSGTVPVLCVCCDQPGFHVGRGLIVACHARHSRARTLHRYPPVRDNAEWRATRVLEKPPTPPAEEDPGPRWADAACIDHDPELFFPISETHLPQVAEAKAVCHSCPVLGACDAWEQANPQEHGIWAGRTPTERRRRRARLPERTTA